MPDWFNDGSRSFTISSHVFLRAILLMFCQNKWWEIMIIRIANLREIFTHKSISRQECDIWLKLPYLDSGGRLNALKIFFKAVLLSCTININKKNSLSFLQGKEINDRWAHLRRRRLAKDDILVDDTELSNLILFGKTESMEKSCVHAFCFQSF